MEEIGAILILLCVVVGGYLLYCGAQALWLCAVPLFCGLGLGYYSLISICLVSFCAFRSSPLDHVQARLSGQKLSLDTSRAAGHGLNNLAGVLAGTFTGLLVFAVEAYTQGFEAAFEGSPTLKYVGMALAWALPLCVWAWVQSGGGTNGLYENLVESSLRRRGLLGTRMMSALKEMDGIESAIGQMSHEIGISWGTKYRDAVEEYIESHPEVVADSRPADAVLRMTLQLARNDLIGLRGCADAYQRAMVDFEKTSSLLTLVKSGILFDLIQKIDRSVKGAKHLLTERKWQEFALSMEEAIKAMACLHYDVTVQEEASDSGEGGSRGMPVSDPEGYYARLGVPPDASTEDIKDEYKKLVWKFHPDYNAKDRDWAEEKFKKLQEAYAVLSDEQKRKEYDSQIQAR